MKFDLMALLAQSAAKWGGVVKQAGAELCQAHSSLS